MPNEFIVVGENRNDENELLVKGSDGKYYEYDLREDALTPVEPDDAWDFLPSAEEANNEY